jgi:DNA topoisomerase-1
VDVDHAFAMQYEVIERNQKHVDAISKAARGAEAIWLATDLDREGEAISWHLAEILRDKKLLKDRKLYRVTFGEITPRAIKEAVAKPRELSMDLVNAQQARRALDYLVGFNLSPLLWRKVQPGLSAGRVQSPALRMISEREEEIERFIKQEYWTLEAQLDQLGHSFGAKLITLDGRKLEQFDINNGEGAEAVRARLEQLAQGQLRVHDVVKRDRQRRAAPPFITSTLQQEAARKLGFGTQRTMRIAQQLYEGVAIDGGQTGLITYMRTDSVNLSRDALVEIREAIEQNFGADKLPEQPNFYQSKSKNAQEAHEAIRPSSALRTPASIKRFLEPDQFRLYELIWKRTLACQMRPALLNTVSVDMACGPGHANLFRSTGTTVIEPGFLAVYEEGKDDKTEKSDDEASAKLPPLKIGDTPKLTELVADQHFTEPPPRFSEASLVKALEEFGIGRPSTYASIIQVLLAREYVTLENKRFQPTDVGRVVAKFLSGHFTQYVDYDFTAKLEDELDAVARGEADWVPVLERFWKPFKALITDKGESVSRQEATSARVLGTDPKTGKEVSTRLGRFGPCVQLGNKDDEDKPRFASLRAGQKMDTVTLEQALELFKLPRKLGAMADGVEVSAGIGRFGPFVKAGDTYASLDKEEDPLTVELDRAIELITAKRAGISARIILSFDDGAIQVLKGKFGPYITDGTKNAKIAKDRDPETLTRDECAAALVEAPNRPARGRKGAPAKKAGGRKAPAARKTKTPAVADAKAAPVKKAAAKKAPAKKAAAKKAPAKKAASKQGAKKTVKAAGTA